MRRPRHTEGGYTLLELMIVFTILATLGALFLQLVPFMQEKTRDRRRIYELSNLRRQIELYRNENGRYPNLPDGGGSFYSFFMRSDSFASSSPGAKQITGNYVPNMVPQYFQMLPIDPRPGPSTISGCEALGQERNIAYFSNGVHYKLIYNCSSETDDYYVEHPFYDPIRPSWAWAISDDMDAAANEGW